MTDNRATELQSLSKLKTAGKLRYWRGTIEMPESELHAICDEIQAEHDHAIAATLGKPMEKDLRRALDFMRIWISEDAHLGESKFSYKLEKAEGLRRLEAIEQAIAATLGGRGQMTTNRDVCSHYEPKDDVVAILREAARNLSDYHDAGEALRQLTDTWNVCHALETLADMVERDYVRRESIEEVMDNDRALVEENSMLAGELLKLRAELEKATNNLNSANKDFENARAELTAERDKLKELNEYHALQYELASEDCDRLQAQVDELQSKLAEYEDRSMQYVSLTGGKFYTGTKALTERIAELTAERDNLEANNQQLHTLAGEQAATIDD